MVKSIYNTTYQEYVEIREDAALYDEACEFWKDDMYKQEGQHFDNYHGIWMAYCGAYLGKLKAI